MNFLVFFQKLKQHAEKSKMVNVETEVTADDPEELQRYHSQFTYVAFVALFNPSDPLPISITVLTLFIAREANSSLLKRVAEAAEPAEAWSLLPPHHLPKRRKNIETSK